MTQRVDGSGGSTREGIHVFLWLIHAVGQKIHNIAKPFLQTINAGEDVEDRDPYSTAGGNVN